MAVDESLLESYASKTPPERPTLRLYAWRPAALSLGRLQPAKGSHDPSFLRREGIDLVRRPTGGNAVLHEHERTYAVVARLREEPFGGGVLETYRKVARALCEALEALGLDVGADAVRLPREARTVACFGSVAAHEIRAAGLKLVGSAQLRRGDAFLQHGSILIASDPRRVARAIGLDEEPAGFTDLLRARGRATDLAEIDRALVDAFENTFSTRVEASGLDPVELERATGLRSRKYLSTAWTLEGRPPRP